MKYRFKYIELAEDKDGEFVETEFWAQENRAVNSLNWVTKEKSTLFTKEQIDEWRTQETWLTEEEGITIEVDLHSVIDDAEVELNPQERAIR